LLACTRIVRRAKCADTCPHFHNGQGSLLSLTRFVKSRQQCFPAYTYTQETILVMEDNDYVLECSRVASPQIDPDAVMPNHRQSHSRRFWDVLLGDDDEDIDGKPPTTISNNKDSKKNDSKNKNNSHHIVQDNTIAST
jgi:hypothetical protein